MNTVSTARLTFFDHVEDTNQPKKVISSGDREGHYSKSCENCIALFQYVLV